MASVLERYEFRRKVELQVETEVTVFSDRILTPAEADLLAVEYATSGVDGSPVTLDIARDTSCVLTPKVTGRNIKD